MQVSNNITCSHVVSSTFTQCLLRGECQDFSLLFLEGGLKRLQTAELLWDNRLCDHKHACTINPACVWVVSPAEYMTWVTLQSQSVNPGHLKSFITIGFKADDLKSLQGLSAANADS